MRSPAKRAIVIGMDGASMELLNNMVSWGVVPNLAKLMRQGVSAPMLGTYPTLTPPGWTSLFTGSWPGTHEITDFSIRIPGKHLDDTESGINTGLSRSEYVWNTFERAGKNPILVKVEMSWPPTVKGGIQVEGSGPGVTNYHQISGYHLFVVGQWKPQFIGGHVDPESVDPSALQDGKPFDPIELNNAKDTVWRNLPDSNNPHLEAVLQIKPLNRSRPDMLRGVEGKPKILYGLVYACDNEGYDRIRICRSKDADDEIVELRSGEWSDIWVESFEIDGKLIDGYVRSKLITLTTDAARIELFFPQIWPVIGYTSPANVASDIHQEVGYFLQNPGRDALGIIDDETYFELLDNHHNCLADIAELLTKDRHWDLLMVETHASDFASHFFLGQADELSGAAPEIIQRCRAGLKKTYASIDRLVGRMMEFADEDTLIVACSDHGGTPNKYPPIDILKVLEELEFVSYTDQARCKIDWSSTTAFPVGLGHIFINLMGREPQGIVETRDYEMVQRMIIDKLQAYGIPSEQKPQEMFYDPALPGEDLRTSLVPEIGAHPFVLVLARDDAEILNLRGDLIGDVVYALRPEFDGAHGYQLPTAKFGIGGQHSTFIMAGAGVKQDTQLNRQVRVVDVAPTICYLLGVPMPTNVEGGVIYEALEDPDWMLTILNAKNT